MLGICSLIILICFDIIPAIYLFNQNNYQLTEKSKIFLLWARRSVEDRMLCNSVFLSLKKRKKNVGEKEKRVPAFSRHRQITLQFAILFRISE